jgi:hypothetical protein
MSYQAAWDELRKVEQSMRRLSFIGQAVVFVTALVLINLHLYGYVLSYTVQLLVLFAAIVAVTVPFQIHVSRWWRFRCPRCHKPFFHYGGWFYWLWPLNACRHCRLPKFAPDAEGG